MGWLTDYNKAVDYARNAVSPPSSTTPSSTPNQSFQRKNADGTNNNYTFSDGVKDFKTITDIYGTIKSTDPVGEKDNTIDTSKTATQIGYKDTVNADSTYGTETSLGTTDTSTYKDSLSKGYTSSNANELGSQLVTGEGQSVTGAGAFSGQTDMGQFGYDPNTGAFSSQLSAPLQQYTQGALGGANMALGELGQDFDTTMGARYNALEALQQQDRLQAQLDNENRLFSQGRLGSTGGALQQNALYDAIAQQQGMNANTAYEQALQWRAQQGQLVSSLGQSALSPMQLQGNQLSAYGALAPQIANTTSTGNTVSSNQNNTTGFNSTNNNSFTDTSGVTNNLVTSDILKKGSSNVSTGEFANQAATQNTRYL